METKGEVTLQIEEELRIQAEALFEELGMDLDTAVGIFLRQALRCEGLPFEVKRNIGESTMVNRTDVATDIEGAEQDVRLAVAQYVDVCMNKGMNLAQAAGKVSHLCDEAIRDVREVIRDADDCDDPSFAVKEIKRQIESRRV